MGGPGQKPSNKQPKFLNLLILVHLKNYFIEVLNKFLMCFKTNGLKNFKLTTLIVFCLVPPFMYTTMQVVKTFLLLKHQELIEFLYLCFKIFFLKE